MRYPESRIGHRVVRIRADSRLIARVAALRGGYGTTGKEIVFAVPLKLVGLARGGRLSHVDAFTSLGGYSTGPVRTLDSVSIVLGGLRLTMDGLRARDRMVIEAVRAAGVPLVITLAGGYARRVEDTVAIHVATIEEALRSA